MSTEYIILFSVLGIATLLLGAYLGYILSNLKSQKKKQKESEEKLKALAVERNTHLRESIITISRAAVQNQCELSEACIRVKKLLENYPTIAEKPEFEMIERMYMELKEFPYLEERKALSKQARFTQDKKRFMVEDKFRDPMLKALTILIEVFEKRRELNEQ